VILGNTYHLFLRPGLEVIEKCSGLHKFMGWDRPVLTDSGGSKYSPLQITTDHRRRKSISIVTIDGATLLPQPGSLDAHPADSRIRHFMAFDECPPYPCEYDYAATSLDRTCAGAHRCRAWTEKRRSGPRSLLFGIVQGGIYQDLREKSAKGLSALISTATRLAASGVGEPEPEMNASHR